MIEKTKNIVLHGGDDDRGSGKTCGIVDETALLVGSATAGQHLSCHLAEKIITNNVENLTILVRTLSIHSKNEMSPAFKH